jgi:hypothetical protein
VEHAVCKRLLCCLQTASSPAFIPWCNVLPARPESVPLEFVVVGPALCVMGIDSVTCSPEYKF